MITLADQCTDARSHRKNAHAHARAYGIAGSILPDCHKLKYFLLLAQMLAAILSATDTAASAQQLPQNLHAIASTTAANTQQQQLAGISSRAVSTTGAAACAQQLPGISASSAAGIARQGKHQQRLAESRGIGIRNRAPRFEMLKSPESPGVGYSYKPR